MTDDNDEFETTHVETLKRLKAVIDKSKLDCDESIASVLYSMLQGLDIDVRYTLLSAVLGLKKGMDVKHIRIIAAHAGAGKIHG